ncbi:hypothetical protein H0Z60_13600 [Ectothiorhodospiraceae bacterium WFHF3C12]|nr:hypothetical protein [Ectothiorhodospiraceae bacterium WFHF3C12]
MQNDDRARSLAREPGTASRRGGFTDIKLELGVIMLICIAVGIGVLALDYPNWLELLVLGAVGFVCGGWLALRTRSVVSEQGRREGEHGPGQE